MNISTRQGTLEDIPAIFELVKELAIFERALDQVSNNVDKMSRDYKEKLFDFFVAEDDSKIIGLLSILLPLLYLEREKIVYGGYYRDGRYAWKWDWKNSF